MPESRECIAAGKQTQNTFEPAWAEGKTFTLEAIAIDATTAEAARAGACWEAKEGLVYEIDARCTVKRGQNVEFAQKGSLQARGNCEANQ